MKYRVEVAEYSYGIGWLYTTEKEIDSFDDIHDNPTTAADYIEICAEGAGLLKPVRGDDMVVRILDEEGEVVSRAWVGDIYTEWYGVDWLKLFKRD